MVKSSDERGPVVGREYAAAAEHRTADEFMASIYKDLVAFEDEIIFEVEDALPEFPSESQETIRADVDQLRAERDRLRRALHYWEEGPGTQVPVPTRARRRSAV